MTKMQTVLGQFIPRHEVVAQYIQKMGSVSIRFGFNFQLCYFVVVYVTLDKCLHLSASLSCVLNVGFL